MKKYGRLSNSFKEATRPCYESQKRIVSQWEASQEIEPCQLLKIDKIMERADN